MKKGTINLFCPGMESSTYLLIANGTINLLIILMGLISIYIFNDPNGKVFVQQRQFNSERQKRNYLRINERKRLHTCLRLFKRGPRTVHQSEIPSLTVASPLEVLGKVDLAKLHYFVVAGCEVGKTTVTMYRRYPKYFLVYLENEITSHLIY